MPDYRPELEPLPLRMDKLLVHRGYPVPYFVEWVRNGKAVKPGSGEPEFRLMSQQRFMKCLRERRCWTCGSYIHSTSASFVLGPMCAVNRTSAEPPSHRECAEWSARNCPFLSRPQARRREAGMPPETGEVAGIMLKRNPGVALVWTSSSYSAFRVEHGVLFNIGDPRSVSWWAQGRPATRAEIEASIDSGLPSLRGLAELEGYEALAELDQMVARARELLPA